MVTETSDLLCSFCKSPLSPSERDNGEYCENCLQKIEKIRKKTQEKPRVISIPWKPQKGEKTGKKETYIPQRLIWLDLEQFIQELLKPGKKDLNQIITAHPLAAILIANIPKATTENRDSLAMLLHLQKGNLDTVTLNDLLEMK